MNAHTPGPWAKEREQDSRGWFCWSISSPTVSRIAVLTYGTAGERAEGIADACLIEAGPDMLAALELAEEFISNNPKNNPGDGTLGCIRAAIKKAKFRG